MFAFLCTLLMLVAPLSFDSTEWDFGKVDPDAGTLFHTFRITNDSDTDFRIAGLSCSCSCVNAYIGRTEIRPGETIDLKVSVKPGGYSGRVEHTVTLYGKGEKALQKFRLSFDTINKSNINQ